MLMETSTLKAGVGERLPFVNLSETATTYRAEFPGVGSVSFTVLPGAQFIVESFCGGIINVNIDYTAAPGIKPVDKLNTAGKRWRREQIHLNCCAHVSQPCR